MKPQVMNHPVIILILMTKIYQNQKAKCSIQFQIRIVEFWRIALSNTFPDKKLKSSVVNFAWSDKNSTENKTYDFQGYLTLYLAPRYCQTRYSYLLSHPKLQAERKCLSFQNSFLRIIMVSYNRYYSYNGQYGDSVHRNTYSRTSVRSVSIRASDSCWNNLSNSFNIVTLLFTKTWWKFMDYQIWWCQIQLSVSQVNIPSSNI